MKDLTLVIQETERMLQGLSRTDAKQSLKNALKHLTGRYVAKKDPVFWPAGMLMLGLVECASVSIPLTHYLDNWIAEGASVVYTDDALTGYVLVRLYERTRDEKYLNAAGNVYTYLVKVQKDAAGSIIYHPEIGNQLIYADGAGMTALFLCAYGAVAKKEDATALGKTQLENFFQYGMDEATKLPYHAYDYATREKKGDIGWGRAVGWLLMGCAEATRRGVWGESEGTGTLTHFSEGSEQPTPPDEKRVSVPVPLTHLRADGSFPWLFTKRVSAPVPPTHSDDMVQGDTSATAMIAWAIHRAGWNVEGVATAATDTDSAATIPVVTAYLRANIDNGQVGGALAECIDFSQYRMDFGHYPWGQGAVLAYLAATSKEET